MRQFECINTIYAFQKESVTSGSKGCGIVCASDMIIFVTGEKYTEFQILDFFKDIPEQYFTRMPILKEVTEEFIVRTTKQNQEFSAELLTKFLNKIETDIDETALVKLKRRISSLRRGMLHHDNGSVEHSLLWSNAITFEELLRCYNRVIENQSEAVQLEEKMLEESQEEALLDELEKNGFLNIETKAATEPWTED